jgi:putative hydrolase of the HAD superfamily
VIVLDAEDVLVLDLDDTLYPEWTYVLSGLREVDRWVQRRWGHRGFVDTAWPLFTSGMRGRLFDYALSRLGMEATSADVESMVLVYRNHEPDIRLYPDAERLLERVPPGFRVALITDGAALSQRRKVAALALERVIQTIIVTDEIGRDFWKPSAAPFEHVAEVTNAKPDQLVYVADNIRKDFVAPNALGWRSVRVLRADSVHSDPLEVPAEYLPHDSVESLEKVVWQW